MNAGKYGFAIIGCGMIARFHARAIRDLPNAALVAVHNVREAGARRAGEEFGVDWTTSLDDLLRRDDVDLVTICTPSGAHLEPALAAAQYGKHAIVEKPIDNGRLESLFDFEYRASRIGRKAESACRKKTIRETGTTTRNLKFINSPGTPRLRGPSLPMQPHSGLPA